jgi:type II secretory pathway pseudopilin PulG
MSAVVAVLMLLAALLLPNLLARQATREVTAFFVGLPDLAVFARERAQATDRTVTVIYNEAQGVFSVLDETDPESDEEIPSLRDLPVPNALTVTDFLTEDQPATADEWELRFYPDGRSDGGAVEVDDNGRLRSLEVSPTGAIRLIEGSLPTIDQRRWPAGDYEQRA